MIIDVRKNKHGTKLRTLIQKRRVSCHCYYDIKVELRKEETIESVFGRVGFFLKFFIYLFYFYFYLFFMFLMIAHYHQTKTSIGFWCKRGLNPRSLIQPLETLPVELIEIHYFWGLNYMFVRSIWRIYNWNIKTPKLSLNLNPKVELP